jgi:CRP-like cAMP-binding protein
MSSAQAAPVPNPCSNCKDCPVWKDSLFADLGPALLARLEQKKTPRRIEKNGFVFKQGEAVSGIFCFAHGALKVVQKDDAVERLVRLVGPGGPVGHRSLFTATTYRGTCTAKENAVGCHIPTDVIFECLEGSVGFSRKLIGRISDDLIAAERELHSNSSVAQRLARLLLKLKGEFGVARKAASEFALSVSLTKVEIASMLSSSEETIVRTFNEFKRSGWVRFEGKQIILLSESGLREAALK